MGLRLCVAGLGYRIVKESLFKVGAAAPGSVLSTRGGNIELGFEVYPLDGAPEAVTRLGGASLPASRLHLTEGNLAATPGYTVSSLTSTSHHLSPNPLTKHEGATFFSGEPSLPPPPRVVVGAESAALPVVPAVRENIVVGHTASEARQAPEAPAARPRTGIVIGQSLSESYFTRDIHDSSRRLKDSYNFHNYIKNSQITFNIFFFKYQISHLFDQI